MQRSFSSGIAAVLSILALGSAPACKDEPAGGDTKAEVKPGDEAKPTAEAGAEAGEGAVAPADGGAAPADGGAAPEGEVAAGEAGAAEAGTGTEPAEVAPAEDAIPGLFALAKDPKTEDEAATKALADAIAAGAAKLDAAKIANERGEALMSDGESERATAFFQWAADTHKSYADPVYNLATIAAYAGDLEIAKTHLQELQKRGNKKLMKKVGVDPAFALLHDDADVRQIYEQ